ncbi:MAG: hypothetical protein JOY69_07945 [Candidatus Eremiobacteraeota bacterium]|nr:hypothetical protein [Candidatus Eremiobacteraeota bacterium]
MAPTSSLMRAGFFLSVLLAAAGMAACGGSGGASGGGMVAPPVTATSTPAAAHIDHVVIVIQENRSFDNFFATFPGAEGTRYGRMHTGARVRLASGPLATRDLSHAYSTWVKDYDNAKMDGFDTSLFTTGQQAGKYPYRYVDPSDIAPYWTMAHEYVLADHMFQTQGSGSFTAHQDLIAGGTAINSHESLIDYPSLAPWGCDAPAGTVTQLITADHQYLHRGGPFPCLDYPTVRDLLDAAKVSWKYYTPSLNRGGSSGRLWNAFDAIRAVRYSSEWSHNVSSPNTNVFRDIARRKFPAVSWVIPDAANSDHPGGTATGGPSWVASIVNAIGESPYWNTSAVIVVWDDWGGLYDHVAPPQLDYQGLGFRVPCLIVSPYARSGYVSHTQYEFASILKFIEDNWALGRINSYDRRANSIVDAFDFSQPARAFKRIPAPLSQSYFERQPPSNVPVDTQ